MKGGKIVYIDGVGLCKVEVLVSEEDVKKKANELDSRIEELFRKARGDSIEFYIDYYHFKIHENGDKIILRIAYEKPYVVKSGFAVWFSRKSREGEYSDWNGAWNSPTMWTHDEKVTLEEFEQILDAFITAKQVLEKVCLTDSDREEFIDAFWEHFSIDEPHEAVEKAVKELWGGEGA